MKFIRDIMSRKSKEPEAVSDDVPAFEKVIGFGEDAAQSSFDDDPSVKRTAKIKVVDELTSLGSEEQGPNDEQSDAILEKARAIMAQEASETAVNIWDIEDENDTDSAEAPAAQPIRRRRNATRVLSFDGGAADIVPMFDAAPPTKPAERTKFPVGWILVADGPGRGECFTLEPGMSQIGRGDDQAIQLDFGDNSISRTNHAAIVYDTETHAFMLGHGGKKNIVRLNGSPVISNETLKAGDKIKIGETELHFVPLCTEEFNWADTDNPEESDDVAIA
ncbi:FHA domain-containing protein [Marivita sp. S0852]|uniref:FHA domain-containing protein n=1 Tax=Marivita sp. S0852 TaxID=3373893 RepID=UPI0039823E1E